MEESLIVIGSHTANDFSPFLFEQPFTFSVNVE